MKVVGLAATFIGQALASSVALTTHPACHRRSHREVTSFQTKWTCLVGKWRRVVRQPATIAGLGRTNKSRVKGLDSCGVSKPTQARPGVAALSQDVARRLRILPAKSAAQSKKEPARRPALRKMRRYGRCASRWRFRIGSVFRWLVSSLRRPPRRFFFRCSTQLRIAAQ